MTTVLDIITDGYRETNLIGKGVVPDDTEQADGLRRLSALMSGAVGFEIGEQLGDWPIGLNNVDTWPPFFGTWNETIWRKPFENSRLLINSSEAETVVFPIQPNDGARMAVVDIGGQLATYPLTLEGNGRLIEAAPSLVINTSGYAAIWMYRADTGNWVKASPLAIDGEMPFPPDFDDYFVTKLAMRLNPRYGKSLSSETVATLQSMELKIQARYGQSKSRPADLGVLNLSVQAYNAWIGRGQSSWFNQVGWMQ